MLDLPHADTKEQLSAAAVQSSKTLFCCFWILSFSITLSQIPCNCSKLGYVLKVASKVSEKFIAFKPSTPVEFFEILAFQDFHDILFWICLRYLFHNFKKIFFQAAVLLKRFSFCRKFLQRRPCDGLPALHEILDVPADAFRVPCLARLDHADVRIPDLVRRTVGFGGGRFSDAAGTVRPTLKVIRYMPRRLPILSPMTRMSLFQE